MHHICKMMLRDTPSTKNVHSLDALVCIRAKNGAACDSPKENFEAWMEAHNVLGLVLRMSLR